MALERELKFSSPEGYVPSHAELEWALSRAPLAGQHLEIGAGRVHRHRDTYYDDATGTLAAAGLVLRRREQAGGVRLLTFKGPSAVTGALHEREELEVEDRSGGDQPVPEWPAAFASRLRGMARPGTLAPTLTLAVTRVSHRLRLTRPAAGPALLELAFDEVSCELPSRALPAGAPGGSSGTARVEFHEVELEALKGTEPDDLERISRALATLIPLNASSATKAERARALLDPFGPDPG